MLRRQGMLVFIAAALLHYAAPSIGAEEISPQGCRLAADDPLRVEVDRMMKHGEEFEQQQKLALEEKVNVLARAVADALKQIDEVDFIEDPNTIRQETRRILEELLNHEERIDQAARQKIESQKRTILEGSQEWDILYRKYYNEEVKKLGI